MQEWILIPGPEVEPGKKKSLHKKQMNFFERRHERALTPI